MNEGVCACVWSVPFFFSLLNDAKKTSNIKVDVTSFPCNVYHYKSRFRLSRIFVYFCLYLNVIYWDSSPLGKWNSFFVIKSQVKIFLENNNYSCDYIIQTFIQFVSHHHKSSVKLWKLLYLGVSIFLQHMCVCHIHGALQRKIKWEWDKWDEIKKKETGIDNMDANK